MTPRRVAWILPGALVACLLLAASPKRPGSPDLSSSRLIDLTHAFDERTIYWPTSPSGFELKPLASGQTPGGWFYAANSFCAPEHGGTHLDAPHHFAEGGQTADQIPLASLIGPAAVFDVRVKAAADPDYRLTEADVRAWEAIHGPVRQGSIALLCTGWSSRWPDRKRYLGDDRPGDASNLHFPSFGEAAARLLIHDRRVRAIGLDTASIDYGPSKDFPVHRLAGEAGVPGLENVANLEEVPAIGAWVFALPMKIAGGSGGPLRIVAVVPEAPAAQ
ncbi:MAG TPA: cyclase family protein [Thermoanaerobaculia bacterium]|nr:cyclase family protein [Thermoanaerobaculia bacterium]